ncbi:hypothetical protein MSG28_009626, partial [Choristoneura fumiferana]
WDIKSLLEKIPNLGGVVDLTNTARYYNPADLKTAGVLHVKILMLGRVIPPENKVKQRDIKEDPNQQDLRHIEQRYHSEDLHPDLSDRREIISS